MSNLNASTVLLQQTGKFIVWHRRKRIRNGALKQYIKEKSLEDFEEDLTGEEMKTFKQHIKEAHSIQIR